MHGRPVARSRVSNVRITRAPSVGLEGPGTVAMKLPLHPGHPERICWGCAKYCPADDMACGNGTDRGQHPIEIFGDDWLETGLDGTVPEVADHPAKPR